MRKVIIGILIISNFCLALTGCTRLETDSGGTKQIDMPTDTSIVNDNFNAVDAFIKTGQPKELGSFYIGPQIEEEQEVFVYSGQAVHIPFKVEGMSETQSDFGLILFVDGHPQSFKIQENDGKISEEGFMHKFSLNNHQIELFDIVFTPVAGKQGEKVGIVFAAIFKPDFIPESKTKSNYGVYHSITAPLPQELYLETGVPSNGGKVFSKFIEEDIPQDIIDRHARHESRTNMLDSSVITALLPDGADSDFNNNVFLSENKKTKFRFRIMGGPDGITHRTVIYINHQPIKIMGFDSLETKVRKGKMYTVEFELDTSEYDQLSTIYAISNPSGKDYMSKLVFPIKTKSGLVVSQ